MARYVAGCVKYQKSMGDRYSRETQLVGYPTRKCLFKQMGMDFVAESPESGVFNAIIVITEQFTKVQDYIQTKTTWTPEDIADPYINDIWKLYGLLRQITSHCSSQFAYKFFKVLNWKLNINQCLSTAYHPQTDGLGKRAVHAIKEYLRIYCHDRQNHWRALLPLA